MTPDYRSKLESHLKGSETSLVIAMNILFYITQQYTGGDIAGYRKAIKNKDLVLAKSLFFKSLDYLRKSDKYVASIFPSIISYNKARNFYFGKEYEPSQNEIDRFLYLSLCGVYIPTKKKLYIVNLDEVSEETWKLIKENLISDEIITFSAGISYKFNLSKLFGRLFPGMLFPITSFSTAFLILAYIAKWMHDEYKKVESEYIFQEFLRDYGISDKSILYLVAWGKEKKESYFIPRLNSLITKLFPDRSAIDYMLGFISSTYIRDKKYKDKSESLLDKFLFYLLNGYLNGELLYKLIQLKVSYELSHDKDGEKIYGFRYAGEFFSRIR